MASSTTKKAVVRRFDREAMQGYVNPQEYLRADTVELLTISGSIISIPYAEVKLVAFVREFETALDGIKVFQSRPKMDGLWVRMTFRDGDIMEGILPNNPVKWEPQGYSITPPEPYGNQQKLFIPRLALSEMSILGVVGSPLTRMKKPKAASKDQPSLFD